MTYEEVRDRLLRAGIDEAADEAAIMLCEYCGVERHELVFRKKENFESDALASALERREKREPLQYILGKWWFHGLCFELSRDCLCPRPDTELCVDLAARLIPAGASFCDIGTGSGAIAVSLLHGRQDLRGLGVDISAGALEMAKRNADSNGVGGRCDFRLCDATDPHALCALGSFDCVVSNPPYIKSADLAGLAPELSYEPVLALDGGNDGMRFYESILSAGTLVRPGGLYVFEIGYDEGEALKRLAGRFGLRAEIHRDCAGNDRVGVIRK